MSTFFRTPPFANHYLSCADHFAKDMQGFPAYVRYMDDVVMWHDDKEVLLQQGLAYQRFTTETLGLTLKPFCLKQCTYGLPFLGYLVYPSVIRLSHRSKIRFIQKMKLYEEYLNTGIWSQADYQAHVLPLLAFTEHASAKGFRRKVLSQVCGQRP